MQMAPAILPPNPATTDQFGTRRRRMTGDVVEALLEIRHELTSARSFEFALRERVARVAPFHHRSFVQVHRIERTSVQGGSLTIVSDASEGTPLCDVLETATEHGVNAPIGWALDIVRQLVDAIAALHATDPDVSHGALTPQRILIGPGSEALICDYVLGSALEQLRYSGERYWTELGVPTTSDTAAFDRRLDVFQLGLVALALLGRPVSQQPFARDVLQPVLSSVSAAGELAPLVADVRQWLARALQLDAPFSMAIEAREYLEVLLARQTVAIPLTGWQHWLSGAKSGGTALRADHPAPASTADAPPTDSGLPVSPPVSSRSDAADAPTFARDFAATGADQRNQLSTTVPIMLCEADSRRSVVPMTATDLRPAMVASSQPTVQMDAAQPLDALQDSSIAFELEMTGGPAVPSAVCDKERTPRPPDFPSSLQPVPPMRGVQKAATTRRASLPFALAALVLGAVVVARYVPITGHVAGSSGATRALAISTPRGNATAVDYVAEATTSTAIPLAQHVGDGVDVPSKPVTGSGHSAKAQVTWPHQPSGTGTLQVRTQPAGAQVSIDGTKAGRSPVALNVAIGEHTILISSDFGSVKDTVTVQSGGTTSVIIPLSATPSAAVGGWIGLTSPIDVQVFEEERLIGTNETERLMVPAGPHQLDIVNAASGYHARRIVTVMPGKVTPVTVDIPNGMMAINALPWAEVWLDGERLGPTPIGNVAASIGRHQVVFRHPTLGEQRRTVVVPVTGVGRMSVDMSTR